MPAGVAPDWKQKLSFGGVRKDRMGERTDGTWKSCEIAFGIGNAGSPSPGYFRP